MNDRAKARAEVDPIPLSAPSWVQAVIALAGVTLLIGPTLGVLWPR